jgi:sigma-B regulation protein RsbQ
VDASAPGTSRSWAPSVAPTILLAHGFGCDQNLWRLVVDRLKSDFRLLLIDLVESGVVGSQALGRGKTPR